MEANMVFPHQFQKIVWRESCKALLAKWGLPEMKFAAETDRLVKLQRPPPEIRILAPGCAECSMTSTRLPRRPAVAAANNPAAPAPMTIES